MTKISSQQFTNEFKGGIVNDAALQARLDKAGVDGKKLLDGVDQNKDGKIDGAELEALWKKLDDLDKDGSRGTISDAKPLAAVNALRQGPAIAPMAPTGPTPTGTLKRGQKGPEVEAAQEKLAKVGYELGPKGADGSYGASTEQAVKDFQKKNKLKPTGVLDPTTMAKLDAAKPPYPEYDKMFKDGVLQTTLAIGFDEDGNDIGVRAQVVEGLGERGFTKLDVKNMSDDELRKKGFDPATIDRNAVYYAKTFKHDGKDVQALVRLVDRDSSDAKGQFAKGMKSDDLILYTGHGRMGSGPDFDHASSSAGNYVIGTPAEKGHYKLGKNDVEKDGALSPDYQLMFFDACNTKWYVDDLRSKPKNKTEDNLDIVASNRELPWSASKDDVFGMLDGVMGGKSMPEIKADLEGRQPSGTKAPAFLLDGFSGNGYQPPES